jgi:dolichol kinase
MNSTFWLFQTIKFISLGIVAYFVGLIAQKGLLRVNYTRKINHFTISFLPELLMFIFAITVTKINVVVSTAITIFYFVLFIKPVREKIPLCETMFAGINRPEDRPFTLLWFMVQYLLAIIVMLPLFMYYTSIGKMALAYIPLFINNIGDGLAEPVGIRFGKHTYSTTALFTKKRYIRTIEGSLCVFVTAVILLISAHSLFSKQQLTIALAIIPLASTIAEAKSPHTMDAPFIIGVSGILLAIIIRFF